MVQYNVMYGYAIAVSSLLAGASVVHYMFKPDLVSCRFFIMKTMEIICISFMNVWIVACGT